MLAAGLSVSSGLVAAPVFVGNPCASFGRSRLPTTTRVRIRQATYSNPCQSPLLIFFDYFFALLANRQLFPYPSPKKKNRTSAIWKLRLTSTFGLMAYLEI